MPGRLETLRKTANFYGRFLPSFSRIGYVARGLPFRPVRTDLAGQTWLVTGATGGIGRAMALAGARNGARVFAVGRNPAGLAALVSDAAALRGSIVPVRCDLTLVEEIEAMLAAPPVAGIVFDAVINNVGVLLRDYSTTAEGFETSYATNLLGHYALTERLAANAAIAERGAIVNVVSGGMYNVPLNTAMLDMPAKKYNGFVAYAAHKRAQLALTDHWRGAFAARRVRTYAMHPGWADTGGVRFSLPTFRKILRTVLRNENEGADTAVWLAATRPGEVEDQVWLDRKPRPAHAYDATRTPLASVEQVVAQLRRDRDRAAAGRAAA